MLGGCLRLRFEEVCPSLLPPTPALATHILHFFLEPSANMQEPISPICVIFRSRAHSLFFILFSRKGSDVPVSQFGSWVTVLSQTWRAGDIDRWLKWSLRNVHVALVSAPHPSFPTPREKRPISGVVFICQALASDPVTRVVASCYPHLDLGTLKLLAQLLTDERLELQSLCTPPRPSQRGYGGTPPI